MRVPLGTLTPGTQRLTPPLAAPLFYLLSVPAVSDLRSVPYRFREDKTQATAYPYPKVPFSVVNCRGRMKKVAPPQPTRHTISGCRLGVETGINQGKVTALHQPRVNENSRSGRNVRESLPHTPYPNE